MQRTARSVVFLAGLAVVIAGLVSGVVATALASIVVGTVLIARSGIRAPLQLAAAVMLLGLATEVSLVAAPPPADWPMLGVAALAVSAAVMLLRSRGRSPRPPKSRQAISLVD